MMDTVPSNPAQSCGKTPCVCGDCGSKGEVIQRNTPDPDPARAALVKQWQSRITQAKKHWKDIFDKMHRDQELARLGADKVWVEEEKYVANIIGRHLNQTVAALYAKNPRCVAKRRERLDFALWDGDPQSLMMAAKAAQPQIDPTTGQPAVDPMTGQPAVDPSAVALLQDAQAGYQQRQQSDRIGKTLEILFHYYLDEQDPPFKHQAKGWVRRAKTCGVAYLKLGFQRVMEKRPEISAQIADFTGRIATLERITADIADGEVQPDDAQAEELRLMLTDLQQQEEVVAREGLTFDFPFSTEIIPDPRVRNLRSWLGASWVAHEMHLTPAEIEEVYQVDVGKSFTEYHPGDASQKPQDAKSDEDKGQACVWLIQDKKSGMEFAICDGYPDFLKQPTAPDIQIERFFTIFALTFNEVEDEREPFPPSDPALLRQMQLEYNRTRQGLREHRTANRPKYFTGRGQLEEADKEKLQSHPYNAIIELNNMQLGQKVSDIIQPGQPVPINPAQYDTSPIFDDILKTVGTQEANLGGTTDATATQSSIAESSRMSSLSSSVDDLDDVLSEVAKASGQAMLQLLTPQTVNKIVGPGAIWPEFSRQQIAEEVFLKIAAGSSGRPNQAAELANLERVTPLLVQTPGLSPTWLLKKTLERLDDDLDLEDAIVEGMPSIIAMNAAQGRQAQPSGGNPASDPNAQGQVGGSNMPTGPQSDPGGQPAYPTVVAPQAHVQPGRP